MQVVSLTIQFVKLENPITAVLSDSHSSIQAIFASSAVKAYTTKHRRRITDQTRGGIIAIAEYEIVATHLGPERSSVTLLVQTLHFGGCEGSAIFGRPVPVERRDRVDQLVQQLRDLRGLDVSNSPHHTVKTPHGTPSPVRSDVDSITSDDRSNGQDDYSAVETQVDFFSQIPRTGQIKSLKAGEPRKAQVPRQRPKTEHVTPRQLEAAPSMMPIECKSMTKHEKLIGLLHNQNPKATRPRTNQIMREPKEATVSEPKTSPESVEIHQNGAHISGSFENSGLTQSKPPESSSGDMIGNGHAEASPLLESSSISDRKATVAVFRENQADNESGVEQSKGQGKVLPASQRVRDATMAPIHGDVQDQVISNDGEVVEKHEQIHKDSEATQSEDKKDGEDIIDPWKVRCTIYILVIYSLR